MKLRITGGILEVEVVEGFSVNDVKSILKKLSEAQNKETKTNIREAGEGTSKEGLTSKSNQVGKLGAKTKLPI